MIIIEIKVHDEKYEYPRVTLTGKAAKYIYVPWSIISDIELGSKRVAVFSYIRMHCGMDDTVTFRVPDVCEWCGVKSNRGIGGTNEKILSLIDKLGERGYLSYLTEKSRSSYLKCVFHMDDYFKICADGYSSLYLDEIEKIMNYKENIDGNISNSMVLLVFAYLRHKIIRRPNELKIEERYPEWIKDRRERLPEAFNETYIDIASQLGISKEAVSKSINILVDLKLLAVGIPYHIKEDAGEYKTPDRIFANMEKREYKYQLVKGKEYAEAEIQQKAKNINKKGKYSYVLKYIESIS